jgi:four helix bundle protein
MMKGGGKMEEEGSAQPRDIQERAVDYALRAIKLYQHLQKGRDGASRLIGKQFFRSATSVGANLAEASSGLSRADFLLKIGIALKEARESLYWLRLLSQSGLVSSPRLTPLLDETNQIISILSAIIINAKKHSAK